MSTLFEKGRVYKDRALGGIRMIVAMRIKTRFRAASVLMQIAHGLTSMCMVPTTPKPGVQNRDEQCQDCG